MDLTRSEKLVLAGALEFVMRFDALPPMERKRALACAAEELGMRGSETRRVASARAGYRDAAMVLEAAGTELDRLLERVRREIPDDRTLRARIVLLRNDAARAAIAGAVATVAAHGGWTRSEVMFVDWLRATWRLPPMSTE